jgi:hypothetical protein
LRDEKYTQEEIAEIFYKINEIIIDDKIKLTGRDIENTANGRTIFKDDNINVFANDNLFFDTKTRRFLHEKLALAIKNDLYVKNIGGKVYF